MVPIKLPFLYSLEAEPSKVIAQWTHVIELKFKFCPLSENGFWALSPIFKNISPVFPPSQTSNGDPESEVLSFDDINLDKIIPGELPVLDLCHNETECTEDNDIPDAGTLKPGEGVAEELGKWRTFCDIRESVAKYVDPVELAKNDVDLLPDK